MDKTAQNLLNILEFNGISSLIKKYTSCTINVNNGPHLNRSQFMKLDHRNTRNISCYGDLVLFNPVDLFSGSPIENFRYRGQISLHGDVTGMFYVARKFVSDLSRWNVENVTNMSYMFNSALEFNSDLSRWNVQNVTNMSNMFGTTGKFDSDLSRWNVQNVTTMDSMFCCTAIFNSDLSRWSVRNVTNMQHMFYKALSFNSDLTKWNVGKVIRVRRMFEGAKCFDLILRPIHR